ncbi:hypothetical protein VdG1_06682 [Verticillium dahliae VDG1]|nr:hypothetical protein VdG1_06682 [Verticillium dahliae VDG1]
MSAQEPTNNQLAEETPADKGKGVAETSVEDSAMDEDDSSSSDEEETAAEENPAQDDEDDDDEDFNAPEDKDSKMDTD